MKKPKYGYCALTADFLHVGHIRLLKFCKSKCQKLIVGIMTDACVKEYKGRKPIMTFEQRREIVESIKFVDVTMSQESFRYPHKVKRLKIFYGKDFIIFDNKNHNRMGADILFPYMEGISSTLFKKVYLK